MSPLKSPVFIMSSERSGSNLLRVLLSNHSNMEGPISPHILNTFAELVPYYGPLSEKNNASKLFDDILTVVNHPYYSWDIAPDFGSFAGKYGSTGLLDFFNGFYSEKISRSRRLVCKENNIFDYAFALKNYYPDCRFVYLTRDPRDYVLSWLKVPVGPEAPLPAARLWVSEQKRCMVSIDTFGLDVCHVRYEDLIRDTEKTVAGILDYIGEDTEDGCFRVDVNRSRDLEWNVFWKNLSKPVDPGNSGKYRTELDERTVDIIESVTADVMKRLGYDPEKNGGRSGGFMKRLKKYFGRTNYRKRFSNSLTENVFSDRRRLIQAIRRKRKGEWRDETIAHDMYR